MYASWGPSDAPLTLRLDMTMQTVSLKFSQSNVDQGIEFIVGQGQIDNQLYLTPLPIMLYAHPNENAPFVHLSLVRDSQLQTIQFFKYFAFSMQEVDIRCADTTLSVSSLTFSLQC